MNARIIGANVLPIIENRFRFLVDEYGFTLAQTSDIPTGAWYRTPRGAVIVQYDLLRDAALDVIVEEKISGESHLLTEILEFALPGAERRTDVRDPEAFAAEVERMRSLLVRNCEDFLLGDVYAFRTRFREALLVKHCRRIASDEFDRGDARRSARLYSALRGYWSDKDREGHRRSLEKIDRGPHLRALR
jgi:hypothetical protein